MLHGPLRSLPPFAAELNCLEQAELALGYNKLWFRPTAWPSSSSQEDSGQGFRERV